MTEAEKVEYDKKVEEETKILKQKALEEIRLANQKTEKVRNVNNINLKYKYYNKDK